MPIEITMPALSPTMTEGNLAKWVKKQGDKVKPGDVIAEIETDKATMEVEAVEEGILGEILVKEKTKNVKVNSVIALLLEEGEDKASLAKYKEDKAKKDEDLTKQKSLKDEQNINNDDVAKKDENSTKKQYVNLAELGFTSPPTVPPAANITDKKSPDSDKKISISPLAKKIAEKNNIAYQRIIGSGPNGRIVKEDIEEAVRTGITTGRGGKIIRNPQEQIHIENSNMRQIIAGRLLQSKQHVPHFYLTIECNLDKLLELRADLNNSAADLEGKPAYRISVNDMVIKAVALAINDNKQINASWTSEAIIQYGNIDISVAVAIDDGLITPIIKNADQKSLQKISGEMKDLATRAKKGALAPEEFQGGGFSISNLGMFNIKDFKAIINPPQSCIMAVGAGQKQAIVKNDKIEIATIMNVSLSCDHRVVDGAVGALFLQSFKTYIEHPLKLIL